MGAGYDKTEYGDAAGAETPARIETTPPLVMGYNKSGMNPRICVDAGNR